MNPHDILRRPIVTEKSVRLRDETNQVTFEVHRDANKIQIREAVEKVFKVHVLAVRTVNVKGKVKRTGRRVRRRPDWKKAIVALKPGESIDVVAGT